MDAVQPLDQQRDASHGELVAEAERLAVTTVARDGRRVRFSTRLVAEERQITVTVHREELVVEHLDEPGRPSEVVDAASAAVTTAGAEAAAELVLHAEEVEVVTRTVPVERVRVFVDRVTTERAVTDEVAREVIEVEGDTDHRPFERDPRNDGPVGAEI